MSSECILVESIVLEGAAAGWGLNIKIHSYFLIFSIMAEILSSVRHMSVMIRGWPSLILVFKIKEMTFLITYSTNHKTNQQH